MDKKTAMLMTLFCALYLSCFTELYSKRAGAIPNVIDKYKRKKKPLDLKMNTIMCESSIGDDVVKVEKA